MNENKHHARPLVSILPFEEKFALPFERLNIEWLEAYFYVEDYDRKVLSQPRRFILDPGGYIFMALVGDDPVGTVALIKRGEGDYELSKMGVTPKYQGLRIGQKLMYYAINFAGEQNFRRLFLDSNTILEPAIRLYRKVGFREIPVPEDSPYERCNIRMELKI
jgi:GNAT superfamily N-acetyltransferase